MDEPLDLPRAADARDVLGGANLADALTRWAADATVDDAARQRARRRWLQVQAAEDASVVGTLVDLAERHRSLTVSVDDHRIRGRIVGLGTDFLALRSDHGQDVLVPTAAVGVVQTVPGIADGATGDRTAVIDTSLAGVLGSLAGDRAEVLARVRGGESVRGELRSVGTDVVRLRTSGDPPGSAWIPIEALALLVVHP